MTSLREAVIVALSLLCSACEPAQDLAKAEARAASNLAKLLVVDLPKDVGQAGAATLGGIGYPMAGLISEESKKGKVYGNWCGADHPNSPAFNRYLSFLTKTNSRELIDADQELHPTDNLDKICMKHDMCYHIVDSHPEKGVRRQCDHLLHQELRFFAGSANAQEYANTLRVLAWAGGGSYRDKDLNFIEVKPIVDRYY